MQSRATDYATWQIGRSVRASLIRAYSLQYIFKHDVIHYQKHVALPSWEDRATAIGNMHRQFLRNSDVSFMIYARGRPYGHAVHNSNVKYAYTSICIAHRRNYLLCAQTWITQFTFTSKLHHACLCSPAAEHHRPLAGTHFTVPRRVEG